jgi:hypothetical protein
MRKRLFAIVVFAAVFIVLSCLPVIPIRSAPVTPQPVYSLRTVSLAEMVWKFGQVGVSYRFGWYTCLVMLTLMAAGLVISVYISKRWGSLLKN